MTSNRPTLLLLHGAGQLPTVWQEVVEALDPEQPMFAPWLKGLKPTDKVAFSVEHAVTDLLNTLELRGIEQADLVGYDLGAIVAARTALASPAIRRLVLISLPAVPSADEIAQQRQMITLIPGPAWKLLPADYRARLDQVGLVLAAQLGVELPTGHPKEVLLQLLGLVADSDLGVDLSQLTCPVLALTADQDESAWADQVATLPQGQVVSLPGARDLLAAQPKGIAEQISQFIKPRP